jgi:hypothetical protein
LIGLARETALNPGHGLNNVSKLQARDAKVVQRVGVLRSDLQDIAILSGGRRDLSSRVFGEGLSK